MSNDKSNRFKYENHESVDAVFNYLSTINKGLKNRHLTFGTDDDMIDITLPNDVVLSIRAENKKGKGSLKLEVTWKLPEEKNEKPDADKDKKAQGKRDRKAEEKKARKERDAAKEKEKGLSKEAAGKGKTRKGKAKKEKVKAKGDTDKKQKAQAKGKKAPAVKRVAETGTASRKRKKASKPASGSRSS